MRLIVVRVALLGLAFKPNTNDMREASSLVLAARLQADGANVRAYDPVAEKEAKRGTSDPTYLVYTVGKLQIMKLRADYKEMKGASYTLQGFHDAIMAQGYPPIKIVRRALLRAVIRSHPLRS